MSFLILQRCLKTILLLQRNIGTQNANNKEIIIMNSKAINMKLVIPRTRVRVPVEMHVFHISSNVIGESLRMSHT